MWIFFCIHVCNRHVVNDSPFSSIDLAVCYDHLFVLYTYMFMHTYRNSHTCSSSGNDV